MLYFCNQIRREPGHMLWKMASGFMPGFLDEESYHTGWVKMSHRGVQVLSKFSIPRKQKSYIFSPRWEIRIDNAFEQVMRLCADHSRSTIQKRSGLSWISEDLIQGMIGLNKLGYAHSFEAWENGQLVGGVWGFHMGSMISMNSMFHTVSNAGKAAFARAQIMLRDRGFTLIDMNGVPNHLVNFGIEWMPQAAYEQQVAELIQTPRTVADNIPCPPVPAKIIYGLKLVRKFKGLKNRLRR